MPDYNSLVIYELHLGTFDDDPGDPPGDLARATSRLDHLLELGINCVHVMPLMNSLPIFPGDLMSPSHLLLSRFMEGLSNLKSLSIAPIV